jgi:hypothetical protein
MGWGKADARFLVIMMTRPPFMSSIVVGTRHSALGSRDETTTRADLI